MKYDLVLNGEILKTRSFESTPPSLSSNKGKWLERVEIEAEDSPLPLQKIEVVHTVTDTQSIHSQEIVDRFADIQGGATKADQEAEHLSTLKSDAAKEIRAEINEKRRKILEAGFTYNFQDGTPGVVEIRKESDDKANIMGIVLSGMNLVQAGNFTPTDDEKPFYIDQADVKHLLTGPEAVTFGQAVFDWVGKIYDAANQHKKTFETNNPATGEAWTAEEIRAYDFSGGWEV